VFAKAGAKAVPHRGLAKMGATNSTGGAGDIPSMQVCHRTLSGKASLGSIFARRRSLRGGQAVPEAAKVAQQAGDRLQKTITG